MSNEMFEALRFFVNNEKVYISPPIREIRPGLIRKLEEDGMISRTVSTGSLRKYERSDLRGAEYFVLTSSGREAYQAAREVREKEAEQRTREDAKEAREERIRKKEVRKGWFQFWMALFLGWILGCFTPLDLWRVVVSFLEKAKMFFH